MQKAKKAEIICTVDELREEIISISREIHAYAELSGQEVKSAALLKNILERNGFQVTGNLAGIAAAFKAEISGKILGPRIALLAEYDALPEMGHACGHNLIAAASVGAGLALSRHIGAMGGSILVIGTPAEETNGAKVQMLAAGVFSNIDVAMMFHPGDCNAVGVTSAALDAVEFVFHGKAVHAATAAEYGINALDGLLEFFSALKKLKKNLPQQASIQGIISEGGTAPNIIPERAAARFYLRESNRQKLDLLVEKVIKTAGAAALATGTTVEWSNFETSYEDFISNVPLSKAFSRNLKQLGIRRINSGLGGRGSLDIGNVSHYIPSIHPYLQLVARGIYPHSREFADAAGSPKGSALAVLAAKAMAATACDVLLKPELMEQIRQDFQQRVVKQRLAGR